MDEEKILTKIEKIMELASRGSTPEERDTAMMSAQKLLDKHNLSMTQVTDRKKGEKNYTSGERMYAPYNITLMEKCVTALIQKYYSVAIISYRTDIRELVIFGKAHNIKVASYLHPWLMNEFNNRWQEFKYQEEIKGAKLKDTFVYGIYEGLGDKLKAQREETIQEYDGCTDLAVLSERDLILNELRREMDIDSTKAKLVKIRDQITAEAGYTEGSKISLNVQIGG